MMTLVKTALFLVTFLAQSFNAFYLHYPASIPVGYTTSDDHDIISSQFLQVQSIKTSSSSLFLTPNQGSDLEAYANELLKTMKRDAEQNENFKRLLSHQQQQVEFPHDSSDAGPLAWCRRVVLKKDRNGMVSMKSNQITTDKMP